MTEPFEDLSQRIAHLEAGRYTRDATRATSDQPLDLDDLDRDPLISERRIDEPVRDDDLARL